MYFKRFDAGEELRSYIECFWLIQDNDTKPRLQKIIPDGFTEIIFHFGDAYRINLNGTWKLQTRGLLAGQVRKHFFLENTGASSVLGIKFRPTALTHLFDISMHSLTDKVVDLAAVLGERMNLGGKLMSICDNEEKIALLKKHFQRLANEKPFKETPADRAVNYIFSTHGMSTVAALSNYAGVGERQLENLFRTYVGISPKFFCRIIRFNYIFELIKTGDHSWPGLAYEAAFFDQSHFIRNFKAFTGDNPASYPFDQKTLANFFLNKK